MGGVGSGSYDQNKGTYLIRKKGIGCPHMKESEAGKLGFES